MRFQSYLGYALIAAGLIFFAGFVPTTTGAVIGAPPVSWAGMLAGILLVTLGVAAVASDRLEHIVAAQEFGRRFRSAEPDDAKRVIVLDTSAILHYGERELLQFLQQYDRVYVPDKVLAEIKDSRLRRIVEENSDECTYTKQYVSIAEKALAQTEKPQLRLHLMPYLKGEKKITSLSEQTRIQRETKRVREIMQREGVDGALADYAPDLVRRKIIDYLDKSCTVSPADIEVMATALYAARNRNHALIGESDIDLRGAVALVKKEHPKIGEYMDCVEPYAA